MVKWILNFNLCSSSVSFSFTAKGFTQFLGISLFTLSFVSISFSLDNCVLIVVDINTNTANREGNGGTASHRHRNEINHDFEEINHEIDDNTRDVDEIDGIKLQVHRSDDDEDNSTGWLSTTTAPSREHEDTQDDQDADEDENITGESDSEIDSINDNDDNDDSDDWDDDIGHRGQRQRKQQEHVQSERQMQSTAAAQTIGIENESSRSNGNGSKNDTRHRVQLIEPYKMRKKSTHVEDTPIVQIHETFHYPAETDLDDFIAQQGDSLPSNDNIQQIFSNGHLLISTMDGKWSVLDAQKGSKKMALDIDDNVIDKQLFHATRHSTLDQIVVRGIEGQLYLFGLPDGDDIDNGDGEGDDYIRPTVTQLPYSMNELSMHSGYTDENNVFYTVKDKQSVFWIDMSNWVVCTPDASMSDELKSSGIEHCSTTMERRRRNGNGNGNGNGSEDANFLIVTRMDHVVEATHVPTVKIQWKAKFGEYRVTTDQPSHSTVHFPMMMKELSDRYVLYQSLDASSMFNIFLVDNRRGQVIWNKSLPSLVLNVDFLAKDKKIVRFNVRHVTNMEPRLNGVAGVWLVPATMHKSDNNGANRYLENLQEDINMSINRTSNANSEDLSCIAIPYEHSRAPPSITAYLSGSPVSSRNNHRLLGNQAARAQQITQELEARAAEARRTVPPPSIVRVSRAIMMDANVEDETQDNTCDSDDTQMTISDEDEDVDAGDMDVGIDNIEDRRSQGTGDDINRSDSDGNLSGDVVDKRDALFVDALTRDDIYFVPLSKSSSYFSAINHNRRLGTYSNGQRSPPIPGLPNYMIVPGVPGDPNSVGNINGNGHHSVDPAHQFWDHYLDVFSKGDKGIVRLPLALPAPQYPSHNSDRNDHDAKPPARRTGYHNSGTTRAAITFGFALIIILMFINKKKVIGFVKSLLDNSSNKVNIDVDDIHVNGRINGDGTSNLVPSDDMTNVNHGWTEDNNDSNINNNNKNSNNNNINYNNMYGSKKQVGKISIDLSMRLGKGRQGDVFCGEFESRPCAVKRMLKYDESVNDKVHREVTTLIHVDNHDNVVRYYAQENDESFIYVALELCQCSLYDVISNIGGSINGVNSIDSTNGGSLFRKQITKSLDETKMKLLYQYTKHPLLQASIMFPEGINCIEDNHYKFCSCNECRLQTRQEKAINASLLADDNNSKSKGKGNRFKNKRFNRSYRRKKKGGSGDNGNKKNSSGSTATGGASGPSGSTDAVTTGPSVAGATATEAKTDDKKENIEKKEKSESKETKEAIYGKVDNKRHDLLRDETMLRLKSMKGEYVNPKIRELCHDMMCGVYHLHSENIVHRDIKPQNILIVCNNEVDDNFYAQCKLADMGLAKSIDPLRNSFDSHDCGTLLWNAPEFIFCKSMTDLKILGYYYKHEENDNNGNVDVDMDGMQMKLQIELNDFEDDYDSNSDDSTSSGSDTSEENTDYKSNTTIDDDETEQVTVVQVNEKRQIFCDWVKWSKAQRHNRENKDSKSGEIKEEKQKEKEISGVESKLLSNEYNEPLLSSIFGADAMVVESQLMIMDMVDSRNKVGQSEDENKKENDELRFRAYFNKPRLTSAVDIFSLGCVFSFLLSGGKHPYGDTIYEQEKRMRSKSPNLCYIEHIPEAYDLISKMIHVEPDSRLLSFDCHKHPFFWDDSKKLQFLLAVSDKIEKSDPMSEIRVTTELSSVDLIGNDWSIFVDSDLLVDSRKHRKYNFSSVRDYLRLIRNKWHHFDELPETLQYKLGGHENVTKYLLYFTQYTPKLLFYCYQLIGAFCPKHRKFLKYYQGLSSQTFCRFEKSIKLNFRRYAPRV